MSYARISLVIIHTAAEWAASSQVLNTFEAGLESDTGLIKRGDGINIYPALSYLLWGSGGGGPESDPVFTAWLAGPPNLSEFTDDIGFITAESDPAFMAWLSGPPNVTEFTNDAGYLVSAGIVGATKTKITYGANGLVSAGADATTADIADSSNKRYVTDAQLVVLGNTSGTNTGDQTSIAGLSGTKAQFNTANSDGDFVFVGDALTLDYNNVLYNQIFS